MRLRSLTYSENERNKIKTYYKNTIIKSLKKLIIPTKVLLFLSCIPYANTRENHWGGNREAMNIRFSYTLYLFIMVFMCSSTDAIPDLETTRNTISAILHKELPTSVGVFDNFFKQYDERVCTFFDKRNNDSLKTHIEHMEQELYILKNICDDMHYHCIKPILTHYHMHISELITLLKEYINSHDTLSLAFKVREFKHILPHEVKQRGDISLFWSLHHRLRCG